MGGQTAENIPETEIKKPRLNIRALQATGLTVMLMAVSALITAKAVDELNFGRQVKEQTRTALFNAMERAAQSNCTVADTAIVHASSLFNYQASRLTVSIIREDDDQSKKSGWPLYRVTGTDTQSNKAYSEVFGVAGFDPRRNCPNGYHVVSYQR